MTAGHDGPNSVFAADLDGDGDADVLSASSGVGRVCWYENLDGLGNFGNQRVITTAAESPSCVVAADLDGDGDPDAVAASHDDDGITWFENADGLGSFGPSRPVTNAADGARWVHAADLDGDGDQDVLSASYAAWVPYDDKIAWYENSDGLGNFGPQQVITTSADFATSVFAADLDGDGDRDALSAAYYGNQLSWHENLQAPLMVDVDVVSLASGGAQHFELTAGGDHALERYLVLGSLSGTSPGLPVNGHVLPLNSDEYFLHTVAHPNSSTHVNTLGDLTVDGTASASLVLPPGLSPVWAGQMLHHAYVVFDLTATPGSPFPCFVSNAVALQLLP